MRGEPNPSRAVCEILTVWAAWPLALKTCLPPTPEKKMRKFLKKTRNPPAALPRAAEAEKNRLTYSAMSIKMNHRSGRGPFKLGGVE